MPNRLTEVFLSNDIIIGWVTSSTQFMRCQSLSKEPGSIRSLNKKETNNMKKDGENLCMLLKEKTMDETVPIKILSKDKSEIGIAFCLR